MLSNDYNNKSDVFIFDGIGYSNEEIFALIKSKNLYNFDSLNADVFTYCSKTLVFVYPSVPLTTQNVYIRLKRKK